jgi:DNA polymerase-3 subunit epsilon
MRLKLTRPVCVLDLETTGINIDLDRIVQIAIIKKFPDGSPDIEKVRYVNPDMPIPEGATAVHGITDLMVRDEPIFASIARGLYEFIYGCDIINYNGNSFDIPMLYNELYRCGIEWNTDDISFVDAMNIFKIKESRNLANAVKFYCDKEHAVQHDARFDAMATFDVLEGQLGRYNDLPIDIEQLALYSNFGRRRADVHNKFFIDDNGDYVINFGMKCKGQLAKNEIGFIQWMLHPERNFAPDTKKICYKILEQHSKDNPQVPVIQNKLL